MTTLESCMGQILESNYTIYNDREVNEAIGRQVLGFTRIILAQVKDMQSLHLLGGYGRGEGSIIREKGGITPLGDYDFLVVSGLPHSRIRVSGIEHLQRVFRVQYQVGVDSIWKPLLPFLDKRIYWYETKFGSKLLWGDKRSLGAIPIYDSKDVNLREGFSLMSNRLLGLEMVFDPILLESKLTEEQRRHIVFQSVKAILACGDSLLLLYGKYHYSYGERCRRLLEGSKYELTEFLPTNPNFGADYLKATHFKLKPSFDMYSNPIRCWIEAKNYVLQALTFFLNKTLPKRSFQQITGKPPVTTVENFPDIYLNASRPDILDFVTFNRNMVRRMKSFKNIFRFQRSFSDIVRACLYYLACSIKTEREIDQTYLEKALTEIGNVVSVSKKTATEKDLIKKWQLTRDAVVGAWRLSRS